MSEQKNQPEQTSEVKPEVIFEQRKAKIAEFESAGLKPYGTRYDGAIPTADAKKLFVEDSETQARVNVAGRMTAFRAMGKAVFADVKDSAGRIQIYVSRDAVGEDFFRLFKKFDIGDIVGEPCSKPARERLQSRRTNAPFFPNRCEPFRKNSTGLWIRSSGIARDTSTSL